MRTSRSLALVVTVAALAGCAKNPAEDVPKADVSSASNAPAASAGELGAGKTYAFGPNDSSIEFVGSKVTGSHKGGFKQFAGELRVVNGKIADAGNKVVINTTSLWSDNERLTGHLKSPDFFDVAKNPTATFVTSTVTPTPSNSIVAGNLTLHGVTKHISFPAKVQVSDQAVDVSAQFFINRFDFEMKYPGKADDLIRKEVVLNLKLKATPGKADFQSVGQPAQTASAR
jgi:polyisoprenoid-binding protein YceI